MHLIGGTEWLILILGAILLLFGSKKVPELARGLGRAIKEFERGKIEVEEEIRRELLGEGKDYREKLIKLAEKLGIETEGKSEEQILDEILSKMEEERK